MKCIIDVLNCLRDRMSPNRTLSKIPAPSTHKKINEAVVALKRSKRALLQCGDPNLIKCTFCGEYSPRSALTIKKQLTGYSVFYHMSCYNAYHSSYYKRVTKPKRKLASEAKKRQKIQLQQQKIQQDILHRRVK